VGDNIRGTALGAADTITHSREGEAKNDTLARGGREEAGRGMDMLKNKEVPASVGATGADAQASHQPFRSHDQNLGFGSNSVPDYRENRDFAQNAGFGSGSAELTGETVTGTSHPQHHRDDAISNDPDAVGTGRRHLSHPMQRVDRE